MGTWTGSASNPPLLIRRVQVIKLILDQLPARDFIEDAAVRLVCISVEVADQVQVFDHPHRLFFTFLGCGSCILFWFCEIICRDDVLVRVCQDAPMTRQESSLV